MPPNLVRTFGSYPNKYAWGPQGEGFWTGTTNVTVNGNEEENIFFTFNTPKQISKIHLYGGLRAGRFPRNIQVMASSGTSIPGIDSDWTPEGTEHQLSISDIPNISTATSNTIGDLAGHTPYVISGLTFNGQILRIRLRGNFNQALADSSTQFFSNSFRHQLLAVEFFDENNNEIVST